MNASRAWFEKDFYKVLGVAEDASQDQIKRAYRKLATELHPDRNPGNAQAEERMKEASEAYGVLGDPQKRSEYDEVRRMQRSGFAGGGFPGGGGGFRVEDLGDLGVDLGDLFGGMFGGGRRRARAQRGPDLETRVSLSFEDAARGATAQVTVRRDAPCHVCLGSGDRSGTATICTTCAGSGQVSENQGPFAFMRPCPSCGGSGRTVTDPCPNCGGSGVEKRADPIKVRIPAGVKDGARIRVRGHGGAVPGGQPGDLYVVVHVDEHPLFTRSGNDLRITVPVSFAEAALGTKVRVPTLDGGDVTLKVPAGTQPGTTLRARGRGIKPVRGGTGDLLVTVQVEVPRKLSREQRDLIEQLGSLNGTGGPAKQEEREKERAPGA